MTSLKTSSTSSSERMGSRTPSNRSAQLREVSDLPTFHSSQRHRLRLLSKRVHAVDLGFYLISGTKPTEQGRKNHANKDFAFHAQEGIEALRGETSCDDD